jgi:hypothetical protein
MLAVIMVGRVSADDIKTNEWGVITNNVQMSISLKDDGAQIKTNKSLSLLIRIKNTSTNEAVFLYNALALNADPLIGVSCAVISPSGKDISPKPRMFWHGSGGHIILPPNQINEFEFSLSQLCKFDEIGTYKIIAKKIIWFGNDKQFEIVSNPLTIVVSN